MARLFVVFFLLGDFQASEFYVPTFRNTLFHIYGWCKPIIPAYTTYEDGTEYSETSAHKIQTDAEESPKRKNTTFRTRRKIEITDRLISSILLIILSVRC